MGPNGPDVGRVPPLLGAGAPSNRLDVGGRVGEHGAMAFPDIVPVLTDGVIVLRAHTPADLDAITLQSSDPQSQAWTTVPRNYAFSDAQAFLDLIEQAWDTSDGHRYWAIDWRDDQGATRFAGTIDLRTDGHGAAEVGFGLHPQARGRGLMARAVRLLAQYWFDDGGIRLRWQAGAGNFASWRVAWACGFTFHAVLPDWLPAPEGGLEDAWVASLARDEPRQPQTPWFEPPERELLGIRLRPWRDNDLAHVESPDVPAHFMPPLSVLNPVTFPQWLLERRRRMSVGQAIEWCIAACDDDRVLGSAVLFDRDGAITGDTAELGYQLLPSARGQGVTRTAARMALAHAFAAPSAGGLGLRRVTAQTSADNAASNRVLDSLGFTVWGVEPAADVLPDGRHADALHWALDAPRP